MTKDKFRRGPDTHPTFRIIIHFWSLLCVVRVPPLLIQSETLRDMFFLSEDANRCGAM